MLLQMISNCILFTPRVVLLLIIFCRLTWISLSPFHYPGTSAWIQLSVWLYDWLIVLLGFWRMLERSFGLLIYIQILASLWIVGSSFISMWEWLLTRLLLWLTSCWGVLSVVLLVCRLLEWMPPCGGSLRSAGGTVSTTNMRRPRSAKCPQLPPANGPAENKKKFFGGASEVLLGCLAAFLGICHVPRDALSSLR